MGLYNCICAVAKPFEYGKYYTKRIKQRMKERQASRIAPKKAGDNFNRAKAKVNPYLTEHL